MGTKAQTESEIPPGVLQGLDSGNGDLDAVFGPRLTELVRRIVRGELYRSRYSQPEDVEDVCSDCMVALLARMEDRKTNPVDAAPIEDFDAYVAVIARRACSAWSRRRHPGFHRLRTRLRYLLLNEKRFALWQDSRQQWVCGLARWQAEGVNAEPGATGLAQGLSAAEPASQVAGKIFERAGRPLYFNDLVKTCAEVWAVNDSPAPEPIAETARPDSMIDRQARLRLVWAQISELPQRQRMALLLNMTGPDGECGTSLLVITGIVSPRQAAEAIGMRAEEFAELLVRLPLSDLEIAERMQITRQQVINLRKCARERLRRRMGAE